MAASEPNDAVLTTRGLTKHFGRKLAVDSLDLTVERGDVFGFLGPNGAGKTTTIRMAVGLVRPTSGEVEIAGRSVRKSFLKAIQRVGVVLDVPAFYHYLSGGKNLQLLAQAAGGCEARRVDEVLDAVGLLPVKKDKVGTYSHGMRQRLGIAQALVMEPELLILDEPTNGLDPEGKRELLALIKNLAAERGVTIFISSHLLEEIEEICNRAAIIDDGRLLVQDRVEALLAGEARYVRLRVTDDEQGMRVLREQDWIGSVSLESDGRLLVEVPSERRKDVATVLVRNGIELSELTPQRTSLREFFLDLVAKKRNHAQESVATTPD